MTNQLRHDASARTKFDVIIGHQKVQQFDDAPIKPVGSGSVNFVLPVTGMVDGYSDRF
jgi:hypothetical protein